MSLLPRPFLDSDSGSSRLPLPSFLTNSGSSRTPSHFPPWYGGSRSSEGSKTHQHLSQNRSVQLGVPAAWTITGSEDELPTHHWSRGREQRHSASSGYNQKNYGHPRGGSMFCDTCNRGFRCEEELDEHLAEHIKCLINGCKFEAHPKLVALHQKMQHSTGLAEKIMCLDTPEDICKWREERKRNFPTAANVERKKREQAEKTARGEDIQNKFFGKMRQGKPGPRDGDQPRGRGRGRGRRRHRNRGTKRPATDCEEGQNPESVIPVPASKVNTEPSQGECLPNFNWADFCNDSDEETKRKSPSPDKMAAQSVGGSLSLLAGYGSGSDSNAEKEDIVKPKRSKRFPSCPVPDLFPIPRSRQPGTKNLSLLEKLLSDEIRHERNVILQCVYYTVRKNFFEKN